MVSVEFLTWIACHLPHGTILVRIEMAVLLHRIGDMMDISADDLMGKNLYDYCHAEDLQKLRKAHVDCE